MCYTRAGRVNGVYENEIHLYIRKEMVYDTFFNFI